jgi:hypothetical protein
MWEKLNAAAFICLEVKNKKFEKVGPEKNGRIV